MQLHNHVVCLAAALHLRLMPNTNEKDGLTECCGGGGAGGWCDENLSCFAVCKNEDDEKKRPGIDKIEDRLAVNPIR